MTRDPSSPNEWRDNLDQLLKDVIARFNERDLPQMVLRDVGLVLIRYLAPPGEVEAGLAEWQDRWRETVLLEQQPMRKSS